MFKFILEKDYMNNLSKILLFLIEKRFFKS